MIVINKSCCDECGTCIAVCPADAILLEKSLCIDIEKCTECQSCVMVCPFGALAKQGKGAVS